MKKKAYSFATFPVIHEKATDKAKSLGEKSLSGVLHEFLFQYAGSPELSIEKEKLKRAKKGKNPAPNKKRGTKNEL